MGRVFNEGPKRVTTTKRAKRDFSRRQGLPPRISRKALRDGELYERAVKCRILSARATRARRRSRERRQAHCERVEQGIFTQKPVAPSQKRLHQLQSWAPQRTKDRDAAPPAPVTAAEEATLEEAPGTPIWEATLPPARQLLDPIGSTHSAESEHALSEGPSHRLSGTEAVPPDSPMSRFLAAMRDGSLSPSTWDVADTGGKTLEPAASQEGSEAESQPLEELTGESLSPSSNLSDNKAGDEVGESPASKEIDVVSISDESLSEEDSDVASVISALRQMEECVLPGAPAQVSTTGPIHDGDGTEVLRIPPTPLPPGVLPVRGLLDSSPPAEAGSSSLRPGIQDGGGWPATFTSSAFLSDSQLAREIEEPLAAAPGGPDLGSKAVPGPSETVDECLLAIQTQDLMSSEPW